MRWIKIRRTGKQNSHARGGRKRVLSIVTVTRIGPNPFRGLHNLGRPKPILEVTDLR